MGSLPDRFPALWEVGFDMNRFKIEAPETSQRVEFWPKLTKKTVGPKNKENHER